MVAMLAGYWAERLVAMKGCNSAARRVDWMVERKATATVGHWGVYSAASTADCSEAWKVAKTELHWAVSRGGLWAALMDVQMVACWDVHLAAQTAGTRDVRWAAKKVLHSVAQMVEWMVVPRGWH